MGLRHKGKEMSGESDLIKLYSARILELAAMMPRVGRLQNPDVSVQKRRSEEHTSELQSRPHISYAVFCLKKKKEKKKKKKK